MRELSEHILDITQNSIKANSKLIEICIKADIKQDRLNIIITDDGDGMNKAFLDTVCDPFSTTRTTRKVGLGISLFKDTVEKCEGKLEISSKLNEGTVVTINMRISHIDRPPLGAIADTFHLLIVSNPELDFLITLSCDQTVFTFNTNEVKSKMYPIPLNHSDISCWIREYLKESCNKLFGGKL